MKTLEFDEILNLFGDDDREKIKEKRFLPNVIFEILKEKKASIKWALIPQWESFESGEIDFDSNYFDELMGNLSAKDDDIVIITD